VSIINEALKKIQQSRKSGKDKKTTDRIIQVEVKNKMNKEVIQKPKRPTMSRAQFNFIWKMSSFLTVTALLIVMLLTYQQRLINLSQQYLKTANNTPPAKPNPVNKMTVVFEGVFISESNKIALINKKLMQKGDLLNGMPIIEIDQDRIALQSSEGVLELKAGATYLL
jgi:hypothetical protein